MILYHFTSKHHVDGCLTDGITQGVIPVLRRGMLGFYKDNQWLTENDSFDQAWAKGSLRYDRTEYRLTVKIPKLRERKLIRWLDYCAKDQTNEIIEDLNSGGDPDKWWLYQGKIKDKWIVDCQRKEPKP